jgi:hypothetical protein
VEHSTVNDIRAGTSTTVFSAYGIGDGSDLLRRTYRQLADGTSETGVEFDEFDAAFRAVFRKFAGVSDVPRDVEAATEDGLYVTREQYEGTPGRSSSPRSTAAWRASAARTTDGDGATGLVVGAGRTPRSVQATPE